MKILNIRIELKNPFDRKDAFYNLGCIRGRLFDHKFWEIEHTYYSPMLFDADIHWTRRVDNAGIDIMIGILGYGIHFSIRDVRHWDHEKNEYTQAQHH
jgi:hypothetical protein